MLEIPMTSTNHNDPNTMGGSSTEVCQEDDILDVAAALGQGEMVDMANYKTKSLVGSVFDISGAGKKVKKGDITPSGDAGDNNTIKKGEGSANV